MAKKRDTSDEVTKEKVADRDTVAQNPIEGGNASLVKGRKSSLGTSKRGLLDVKSDYKSSMYPEGYVFPYNPDYLVRTKGSIRIYDQMRRDEQVKAALHVKKNSVLAPGWQIDRADASEKGYHGSGIQDDPRADEIHSFVKQNVTDWTERGFKAILKGVLTALDYGFSCSEIVYEVSDGKIWVKDVLTRPPHGFEFHIDDQGELDPQTGLKQQSASHGVIDLPKEKFVIHSHNPDFGNPYGTSDLQSAYRAWWSKDNIIKFWNIHLERYGSPSFWGKYPNRFQNAEIDDLLDVLMKAQAKNAMVTPDDVDVSMMTGNPTFGAASYENAVDKYNIMIARSLLLPDLIGFSSGSDGGSYALGKKQFDLFVTMIRDVQSDVEATINEQLIKKLVDLNWSSVETYPKFRFREFTQEDRIDLAKVWLEAAGKRVYKSSDEEVNHFRSIVKFPTGPVEREALPGQIGQFPGEENNPMNRDIDNDPGDEVETPAGIPDEPENGKMPDEGKQVGISKQKKKLRAELHRNSGGKLKGEQLKAAVYYEIGKRSGK